MEKSNRGFAFNRCCTMVVLPLPEGPQKRRSFPCMKTGSRFKSSEFWPSNAGIYEYESLRIYESVLCQSLGIMNGTVSYSIFILLFFPCLLPHCLLSTQKPESIRVRSFTIHVSLFTSYRIFI